MSIEAITSQIVSSQTAPAPEESADIKSDINPEEMGSRLAILGKKEKSIFEKQQSLQQKLKEIEEREAKLSKYSKFEEINDENAVDFFKEKGLSLEKIQEKWLSQLNDDDLDPIQKQIKDLQSKLAAKDGEVKKLLDETLAERDSKAKQAEIEQQSQLYNAKLKEFISENTEKFDLISTFEAADEVFKVIKDVYLKTAENGEPKLLKFEEACELYESKLAEMVQGMTKSKKVLSLLGQSGQTGNLEDEVAKMFGQKTIDDSFSQSSSASNEYKTQEERERAAAKLMDQMRLG